VVVAVGLASLGVGIWRLADALGGGSSRVDTITELASPADPSCASPQNRDVGYCANNPCNPASGYYQANAPGCLPDTVSIPKFPVAEPTSQSGGSPPPTSRKPPPAGPVSPSNLTRALDHQLRLYLDVTPQSVSCPPLPRRKGDTIICQVTGTSAQNHMAKLQGTARVTINDRSGQTASATFALSGPGGLLIKGSGYPFDPNTGRVL